MDAPLSLKASGRGRRRLVINKVAELAALSAAIAAIAVLGILVWSVFSRGVAALNLDFFTKGPAGSARKTWVTSPARRWRT